LSIVPDVRYRPVPEFGIVEDRGLRVKGGVVDDKEDINGCIWGVNELPFNRRALQR